MKRWLLLGFVVLGVSLGMLYQYYNAEDISAPRQLSAIEKNADDCNAIARKAATHLPEALPFQKLEKAARTTRVFETCMHDRGFDENPAWVEYAQPIAQQFAAAQSVSIDEAYETVRREHMQSFDHAKTQPSYWVRSRDS